MRVRFTAALKNISLKTIIMSFADFETPTTLVGKKVAPILVNHKGVAISESLDIVEYLDKSEGASLFNGYLLSDNINKILSSLLKDALALTAPRFVNYGKEFDSKYAINRYQKREELFIGKSFDDCISDSDAIKERFLADLVKKLLPVVKSLPLVNSKLSADYMTIFAFLRNLQIIPNFNLPKELDTFLNFYLSQKNMMYLRINVDE